MNIATFDAPIFTFKLEAHNDIKDKLISLIDSVGRFSLVVPNEQKVSHTDWHTASFTKNLDYWGLLAPHVENHIQQVRQMLQCRCFDIKNFCFQWYEKDDFHGIHNHPNSMFSGVYYLKLAGDNPRTSFMLNNQHFEIEITEGDLIMFPSFLCHQSLPNKSNEPKIVIAFNVDFKS